MKYITRGKKTVACWLCLQIKKYLTQEWQAFLILHVKYQKHHISTSVKQHIAYNSQGLQIRNNHVSVTAVLLYELLWLSEKLLWPMRLPRDPLPPHASTTPAGFTVPANHTGLRSYRMIIPDYVSFPYFPCSCLKFSLGSFSFAVCLLLAQNSAYFGNKNSPEPRALLP